MISSGMKRGLATTAVTALAIAGLPLLASSASATPLNSQVATANTVQLAAPESTIVSSKNDGTDVTTRFEAVGGTNIVSVKFAYSLNAGVDWTTMATVASRNDNGAFALDFNSTPLVGATGVQFRAQGLAADGTTVIDTNVDAGPYAINNTADTVDLAAGDTLGVFQQPYGAVDDQNVIVSGTTSDPTQVVQFYRWNSTSFTYTGAPSDATATAVAGTTHGAYTGVVDITGYTYGSGDQLLLESYLSTDSTDDAEAYDLYKQTITTVTAQAAKTDVPAGAPATNVVVTVTDQSGKPIAGARVLDAAGGPAQFTNAQGKATFGQNPGSTYYYADATNVAGFNPELNDKKSDNVTITQYNAQQTSFTASSVDGTAFDYDEYAGGDIQVQLKDQKGADMAAAPGQMVGYQWYATPLAGGATTPYPQGAAAPGGGGLTTIPFPATAAADYPGGATFTLGVGLTADGLGNGAVAGAAVLTVKAGQAALTVNQGDPVQAVVGTSTDVTGKLALSDGTGLGGRSVNAAYAGGTNAGIVQTNGTIGANRVYTTAADGTFSTTIKDPAATPQPAEANGTLTVTTVNGTVDADNPGAAAVNRTVEFRANLTPAEITLTPVGGADDRPGTLTTYNLHVDGDSDPVAPGIQAFPLSGTTVDLSTDHGYFSDGTPAPAPAAGADVGGFKPITTVKTDGSGNATVYLAMGRDAGFDDDGAVTSVVSAAAGTVSDTTGNNKVWNSEDPLNGGEVAIEQADASEQTVGVLPKAPTTEQVAYNVFATDQFGNLVEGESVSIDVPDNDYDTVAQSQLEGDGPAVWIGSDVADDVSPEATWTTPTTVYGAAPLFTPTPTRTGPNEVLTADGETVNFYEINYATSSYTLDHDTADTVPVGTTVVETYTAIDQNGEPMYNQSVGYFRTGPDNYSDGEFQYAGNTGQDGQVSYIFGGAKAGTATIQMIISNGNSVVTPSRATDTVVFGSAKSDINLKLSGKSKGQKDQIKVNANNKAAGKTAVLYKGNKKVAAKALNGSGDFTFSVKDTNGNKKTKYTVKIAPSDTTNGAKKSISIK
jgi:hypothetical protein